MVIAAPPANKCPVVDVTPVTPMYMGFVPLRMVAFTRPVPATPVLAATIKVLDVPMLICPVAMLADPVEVAADNGRGSEAAEMG
jgi:hypothetical protein